VLLRANDLSEQIGKLPLRRLFPNVWWGLLGAIAAVAFALLLVITLVRDQRLGDVALGGETERDAVTAQRFDEVNKGRHVGP